jgi:hypothetical protein
VLKLRGEIANIYSLLGEIKMTLARIQQDTNGNTHDVRQLKEDFVMAWKDA